MQGLIATLLFIWFVNQLCRMAFSDSVKVFRVIHGTFQSLYALSMVVLCIVAWVRDGFWGAVGLFILMVIPIVIFDFVFDLVLRRKDRSPGNSDPDPLYVEGSRHFNPETKRRWGC